MIMIMKTKYMPVDPDFLEILDKEIKKDEVKVIFFTFSKEPELDESKGKVDKIDSLKDEGSFIFFENGDKVRLDKIIVVNGIPGPAYDEYDSYALAPLTCQAGYSNC